MTCSLSNVASQPASHNCPMERSELELRSGNRWMIRAVWGREGMSIVVCAVEEIWWPLGMVISMAACGNNSL